MVGEKTWGIQFDNQSKATGDHWTVRDSAEVGLGGRITGVAREWSCPLGVLDESRT